MWSSSTGKKKKENEGVCGRGREKLKISCFTPQHRYAAPDKCCDLPAGFVRTPHEEVEITEPLRRLFDDIDTDGNGKIR